MSTPSTARPKRARAPRSTATTRRPTEAPAPSPSERHALIAQTAYLRAERRGFHGGDAVADWLESEKEVDALLSRDGG